MTVKELIELLSSMDQSAEVVAPAFLPGLEGDGWLPLRIHEHPTSPVVYISGEQF